MKIFHDVFDGDEIDRISISSLMKVIETSSMPLFKILQLMDSQKYGRNGFKKIRSKENELYCLNAYLLEELVKDFIQLKDLLHHDIIENNRMVDSKNYEEYLPEDKERGPILKTYLAKCFKRGPKGEIITVILDSPI